MAQVYRHTQNSSTVCVTHPYPSSLTLSNNTRLDSAICMPPSRKASNSVKSRHNSKRNEGLERWVDDLLKTLDGVMEKTLGTNVEQDTGRRIKELKKYLDGCLSQEDSIIAQELAEEKKINCEASAIDGFVSDDSITTIQVETDNTLPKQNVSRKTTTLESTPIKHKAFKNSVSKVKNMLKKKVTRKSAQSSNGETVVNAEKPSKQNIDYYGQNYKATVVGRIEKRAKHERLLNDRFLFNKKDLIGEGHHGSVISGIDLRTNNKVAIKCLRKQYKLTVGTLQVANKKQRQKNDEIIHEGRMMIRMESLSDLVPLLDLVETAKKVYYIMPLASKDLSDIIYRHRMTEKCIRELMKPVFQAVKQMHDCGYVHRDIKPENILLFEGGTSKLSDFGLSTDFGCSSGLQVVGTPAFAAPEVLGQFWRTDKVAWLNYKRADIWSLGATLYTSLVGRYPFDDKRTVSDDLKTEVKFPDRFKNYSEDAKDLIKKMMVADPFNRITIDDALNHPFFTKHD